MDANREIELRQLTEREIRYHGFRRGWEKMQEDYPIYELTDNEARYMYNLIRGTIIVLPRD